MTIVAGLLAAALIVTVFLFLRYQAQQAAAWALERRELLNRVVRPDQLPSVPQPLFAVPDAVPDEIDLVGTIQPPPTVS